MTGPNPHGSRGVFADCQHEIAGQAIVGGVVGEPALPKTAQTAPFRADPNRPVACGKDALGDVVHQTLARRINLEFAVSQTDQPAPVRAHPKFLSWSS